MRNISGGWSVSGRTIMTKTGIHDSLQKDTPHRRPVEGKPSPTATVISHPRLGGLHRRYSWRETA